LPILSLKSPGRTYSTIACGSGASVAGASYAILAKHNIKDTILQFLSIVEKPRISTLFKTRI
jgi:hypothetical protein